MKPSRVNPETKSELAVPMIYKNEVIGVLDLEHTRRNYFTEDHKRTISTLASQIAIAIENARLYEQLARQRVGKVIAQLLAEHIHLRDGLREIGLRRAGRPAPAPVIYGQDEGREVLAKLAVAEGRDVRR